MYVYMYLYLYVYIYNAYMYVTWAENKNQKVIRNFSVLNAEKLRITL